MPEREHRIDLSPETREDLVEVRNRLELLMSNHPEIVGMTIFGSNIKGTARNTRNSPYGPSDLDGTLFIDGDKLGVPLATKPRTNGTVDNDLPEQIINEYKALINTALQGTFPYFDIRPEMISREILSEMVKVLVDSGPVTSGNDLSFQRSEVLSKLFRFSFGTQSLANYRLWVLDEIVRLTTLKNKSLEEDPNNSLVTWRYNPDEFWMSIADNLYYWEFMDRNVMWGALDRSKKFRETYPQTIEEAKRYWSLS